MNVAIKVLTDFNSEGTTDSLREVVRLLAGLHMRSVDVSLFFRFLQEFFRETMVWKRLLFPNIVQFYGVADGFAMQLCGLARIKIWFSLFLLLQECAPTKGGSAW